MRFRAFLWIAAAGNQTVHEKTNQQTTASRYSLAAALHIAYSDAL
jgi:hypothetical protein